MIEIQDRIRTMGIIPVIAIKDAESAVPLAEALLEGGLPCAEVTFRTSAASESIRRMSDYCSELLVGAGTVLTIDQAKQAAEQGARFIVTPGFDEDVVGWCISNGVPIFPGIATPTEINMALKHRLSVLKFFPAGALGGIKMLKAIAAPYGGVQFIPTGGVSPENLRDYLRHPSVLACGGSWLAKQAMIADAVFSSITALVREALDIVRQARSNLDG